jgi:hypothetical protein
VHSLPVIPADARDMSVDHHNVGFVDATGEDVQDSPAGQQYIARFFSERHADPTGKRVRNRFPHAAILLPVACVERSDPVARIHR